MVKNNSAKVLEEVMQLCQDERDSEAEDLIRMHLAIDPDNLQLMTNLGVIQARLYKDQKAESTFKSVLAINPNYEEAICGLGRLLDQSLRIEEAEELYREFLQNNPIGHCALEDLCRLLHTENRTDEALILAREHVENYGYHLQAYDAIRYVLNVLEDRLEDELCNDRENDRIFTDLINNLLEQLEMVNSIEQSIRLSENMYTELEDDKTRLISEIKQLVDSAPSRHISISSEIINRINKIKLLNQS
ncbi:MAG: hypothetical protein ACFFCX_10330 [Candidatus Sifarchaeia archaeon]